MKNATLADRIREEHLEVRRSIKEIRDMLASDASGGTFDPAAVAGKLRGFEDHLRGHFALEETEGPLSSSITRTRRQEERANELLRQHPEFLTRIAGILERLESGSPLGSGATVQVARELQQLFDDLGKHESMENILFQEQMYAEDGQGD